MTRIALFIIFGVVAVVGLGLMIDARSRGTTAPATINWQAEGGRICALGMVSGDGELVRLRPQISGRVTEIAVSEGDYVEAGAVLLRLDDSDARHQLALAEAELDTAQADLDRLLAGARQEEIDEAQALVEAKQASLAHAEDTWRRIERLATDQAVSRQQAHDRKADVDRLRAELAAAKAKLALLTAPPRSEDVAEARSRVAAAQARIELAKVRLDRCRLESPKTGRVLEIDVEPGELIGPDSPEPAVIVADTSALFVKAFVEEFDAPRAQLGMHAVVTAQGFPGKKFTGHVVRLAPRMVTKTFFGDRPDEQYDTKTREVWIELDPESCSPEKCELVIGLPVDVTLYPQEGPVPAVSQ